MADHVVTWDTAFTNTPAGSDGMNTVDNKIQEFKDAIDERMQKNHYWRNSVTDNAKDQDGMHKYIVQATESDPTAIADAGISYVKDSAGVKPEKYFRDEDGNIVQFTDAGALGVAGQAIKGNLTGVTGDFSGAVGIDGNFDINTNKVTIAAATGNTVIAGTLNVTGEITGDVTGDVTGGIVETGFSVVMNMKIIEIGNWDMDNNSSFSVAHGLTYSKIRVINGTIRNDSNSNLYPLNSNPNNNGNVEWTISGINSTTIFFNRFTGGVFDSSSFAIPPSSNRGWIIIWYTN